MPTITFDGNTYEVNHAVKGADYIHGYDANGTLIVSFEGCSSFNDITYSGTYMAPGSCLEEGCNTVRYVNGVLKTEGGSTIVMTTDHEVTLLASGWVDNVQTVSVPGMTANKKISVGLSSSATASQYETASKAMLHCTAKAGGTITVTAFGSTPTVDIPILVRKIN